ncbi:hypothetical protein [Fructilactobacillus sanfranciscensis]|uniref:hypothetical protein n=1 Tax=Fructilactobacillus sanfranciscensis TaxID=1625 RepID=UPI0031F7301E
MGEIVKKAYKDQCNSNFPTTPPIYLGRIAKAMWRRVLPVLEQQSVIERIDAFYGSNKLLITINDLFELWKVNAVLNVS